MKIAYLFFLLSFACNKKNTTADAPLPKLTIQDLTLPEGNNGLTSFEFSVKLNQAGTKPVDFSYTILPGTAKAGEDYTTSGSTSLSFQPGETEKKITVNIIADDIREGDEQFTIVLSGISNATAEKTTAVGLILNDDTRVLFTNAGYDAPTSYAGYTLVWADEFDGNNLNAAWWSNQDGDGCPGLCGWGNNELEYYTSRPDNIFFQDGKLLIEARKENYSGRNYTSSKILTSGKKSFKYGRIDIRARLPMGKGIWPALWLLPQNNVFGGWPSSGEIDMMEMIGNEPNKVYGTIHYGPGPGSIQISRNYTLPAGIFNDSFHVFSIEWKQDQLKWYVDGNLYSTVNKTDLGSNNYPFNEDFYLIFNLAVGGNWPGSPDAGTSFPQWLIVDYVRVYQ